MCSYHIVCDCRNYSLHPGFFQPFLCNFSCSASCLLLNVGIDLSTLPSCFSHVFFYFFLTLSVWLWLQWLTFGTTHQTLQLGVFFCFNQMIYFMWGGQFNYKNTTLNLNLNMLSFSYAGGLGPCSSTVQLGRQINRLCSWMKQVLIPLATCPHKHLAPTLQQSPGGHGPALLSVLWRQKPCH